MDYQIRFYMFLSTGLFVGVPTLCRAACSYYQHRLSSGKNSLFIITLLLNDALQLLLTLLFLARDLIPIHFVFEHLYDMTRLQGLWLHQLVALEGAVSVSHSKYAAVFSSVPCSACVTLTAQLVVSIILLFSYTHQSVIIFLIVVPALNNGVMCFFMCSNKSHQTMSRSITAKILAVSMVTYIIQCGPYFVTVFIFLLEGGDVPAYNLRENFMEWENWSFSIIIFRVIADSILVCMLPRITQISQI